MAEQAKKPEKPEISEEDRELMENLVGILEMGGVIPLSARMWLDEKLGIKKQFYGICYKDALKVGKNE